MGMIIEVCVDSEASLDAAVTGGADRIELCACLAVGGLTPSAGFMHEAARLHLPVMAMIRPRAGDFVYAEPELRQMEADIDCARNAGLAGVVFGASLPDGQLDRAVLARLMQAASGLDTTLHRAFDMAPDLDAAFDTAAALGFRRILTSGGAKSASAGATRIAGLIGRACGGVSIMPGGGVSAANAGALVALGATELHGSCATDWPIPARTAEMGFGAATERRTDATLVRALRQAALAALH